MLCRCRPAGREVNSRRGNCRLAPSYSPGAQRSPRECLRSPHRWPPERRWFRLVSTQLGEMQPAAAPRGGQRRGAWRDASRTFEGGLAPPGGRSRASQPLPPARCSERAWCPRARAGSGAKRPRATLGGLFRKAWGQGLMLRFLGLPARRRN